MPWRLWHPILFRSALINEVVSQMMRRSPDAGPSSAGSIEAGARELADDHGPIFSTVAKLVDALQRAVPHSRDLELKDEALRLGRELLRGTKYEGAPMIEPQVIELWPSGHVANARPECRRRALVRNPH